MEHVNLERAKSDRLLVKVIPSAPQLSRLIPDFLHQWIILNDNGIFNEGPGGCRSVSTIIVCRGRHATGIQVDIECRTQVAGAGS